MWQGKSQDALIGSLPLKPEGKAYNECKEEQQACQDCQGDQAHGGVAPTPVEDDVLAL